MNILDEELNNPLIHGALRVGGGLLGMIPQGYGEIVGLLSGDDTYGQRVANQFQPDANTLEQQGADYATGQAMKLVEPIDRAMLDAAEYMQYLNPANGLLSDKQKAANSAMTYGLLTTLGGMGVGKSLLSGAKMGNSVPRHFGQSGMIAGQYAETANKAMLEKAKKMKADGASADEIFKATYDPNTPSQTGWWLDHPDGMPRFEIDDSKAFLNSEYTDILPDIYKLQDKNSVMQAQLNGLQAEGKKRIRDGDFKYYKEKIKPMMEYLQKEIDTTTNNILDAQPTPLNTADSYISHQNMFSAYPDMRNVTMKYDPQITSSSYIPTSKDILIGTKGDDLNGIKASSFHETQHGIQDIEGFARGGSPQYVSRDYIDNLSELANTYSDASLIRKSMDEGNLSIQDARDLFVKQQGRKPADGALMEARFSDYSEIEKNYADTVKEINIKSEYVIDPNKAYKEYEKLAGESEARLTQNDINQPMSYRLENPFYTRYDVPFDEMIIKRGLLNY